jgi:hypothetical protein
LCFADAPSSGEETQRTTSEDTRSTKRLKTNKYTTRKNATTNPAANNDSNENDHNKNPKDNKKGATATEQAENAKDKSVTGGVNGSNDEESTTNTNTTDAKRKEMDKIEREFADLKEKLFKDKIAQLKKEAEAIKNGMTSPTPTPFPLADPYHSLQASFSRLRAHYSTSPCTYHSRAL